MEKITDLSFSALQAIRLLRESGNMSRVAAELNVTQPGVSRMITALEKRFDLRLVKRSSRPLELTDEGNIVAEYAKHMEQDLVDLTRQLERLQTHRDGSVTLAYFGASAAAHKLPTLLMAFKHSYPQISLPLKE